MKLISSSLLPILIHLNETSIFIIFLRKIRSDKFQKFAPSNNFWIHNLSSQNLFFYFQWAICLTYLLPNFACGLVMTFSVTGLPHYQNEDPREDVGEDPEGTTSRLSLTEDEGSWFGMSKKGWCDTKVDENRNSNCWSTRENYLTALVRRYGHERGVLMPIWEENTTTFSLSTNLGTNSFRAYFGAYGEFISLNNVTYPRVSIWTWNTLIEISKIMLRSSVIIGFCAHWGKIRKN